MTAARIQTGALGLLLFAVVAALSSVPVVRESQLKLADTLFRVAPAPAQASPVVLVLIDDESLQAYGRWPWSREILAQLTRRLADAGASVIGLDVLLSEPQSAQADAALAQALAESGRAVIVDKIGVFPDGPRWVEPLPIFSQAAGVGHALAALDTDAVCRRFPVRQLTLAGSRWPLALEMARRVDPQKAQEFLSSLEIAVEDAHAAAIAAKPVLAPIAYRRDGFQVVSAAAVLRDGARDVRGRPVLVGFGPSEISDRLSTPLHGELPTPGVEIHAHILDGILTQRRLHQLSPWTGSLLLLALCIIAIAVLRARRGWMALVLLLGMAALVYAGALAMFVWGAHLAPVGPGLLAVMLAPVVAYTADFVIVERSLNQQLRELRRWLQGHGRGVHTPDSTDLTWRLQLLATLQAELGSRYELHRTLLETTQDAVAIFDQQGQLLLTNQRFAALFPERKTLDQLRPTLVSSQAAPLVDCAWGAEGEAYVGGELHGVRMAPLPETTLSPGGGTVLVLSSLQARLERDGARGEALSFITHELRTPLGAIQGFAELMMKYPGSPSSAAASETIFRESRRLLALITSYLDVLRLDAGARPIRSETVAVDETIEHVFDILRPMAAAFSMRLVMQAPPVSMVADGSLLTGALLNLVSNAIKYGRPGTDIGVHCEAQQGKVVLRVSNVGQPIAEADMLRLFEPYFRAHGAEPGTAGWGLGLAFVKRIAEKHGGWVRGECRGTAISFEIHLPAAIGAVGKGAA